jgi:hypothetical protein
LNGQEVWRFNMPTGPVTAKTPASTYIAGTGEQLWRSGTIASNALRPGQNVVAVEVHQDKATSSDLSFDMELTPTR